MGWNGMRLYWGFIERFFDFDFDFFLKGRGGGGSLWLRFGRWFLFYF